MSLYSVIVVFYLTSAVACADLAPRKFNQAIKTTAGTVTFTTEFQIHSREIPPRGRSSGDQFFRRSERRHEPFGARRHIKR